MGQLYLRGATRHSCTPTRTMGLEVRQYHEATRGSERCSKRAASPSYGKGTRGVTNLEETRCRDASMKPRDLGSDEPQGDPLQTRG